MLKSFLSPQKFPSSSLLLFFSSLHQYLVTTDLLFVTTVSPLIEFRYMVSYSTHSFMSGFCHSIKCFWDLSVLAHASAVCSFFLLNCIPLHRWHVTIGSRLLWIKMLWKVTYKSLCGHKFLFQLSKYTWCLLYFLRNYLTIHFAPIPVI